MNGVPIANASQGETVLMVYGGYQLTDKTINYTVQEYNSSFVWYNPFTWFSKDWNSANKISGNAVEPWVVSGNSNYRKRFVAAVNATSISNISSNLTIIDGTNSVPVFGNINPQDNMRVSVGSLILFNQSAIDEDDLLKITWNFGDGNITTFYNYSSYINSSSADIKHNYTNSGIYYWTLGVEEMNPGRINKDLIQRTVYVLKEGINVVPIVTSPANGMSYGAKWVQFNASQTYVANCTTGIMASPLFKTNDGLLNCSFVHSPGATSTGAYNLTFTWNLGEGASFSGDFDKNYGDVVVFKHRYSTSGRHVVSLNVRYVE